MCCSCFISLAQQTSSPGGGHNTGSHKADICSSLFLVSLERRHCHCYRCRYHRCRYCRCSWCRSWRSMCVRCLRFASSELELARALRHAKSRGQKFSPLSIIETSSVAIENFWPRRRWRTRRRSRRRVYPASHLSFSPPRSACSAVNIRSARTVRAERMFTAERAPRAFVFGASVEDAHG